MKKAILFISMMLLMVSGTSGRMITGKVVDSGNNPLAGVNILIKGTTQGIISDVNGAFTINVPDGNATLIFMFIGYKRQEINITSSNSLFVMMEEDMMQLQEVVVTGYGSVKKSSVTGAVSSVSRDALSGRAAGVTIRGVASQNAPAYKYCLPTPEFNTEGYSAIHENGFKSPLREPLSTFSIDVDAASYSNVRRFINEGQKPIPDAVRIEEMVNYFDYDYPQPKDGNPFSIVYELGDCPWNHDNKLLHIGLQGEKMKTGEIPPSNLVFLLDVSGSMDAPNKLPLLIKAMKLLVSQLRAQDRVAIVVYAGSSGLVLPSTPGNQKEKINAALENLQAGGSTAGSAGLKLAYQVAEENFNERRK